MIVFKRQIKQCTAIVLIIALIFTMITPMWSSEVHGATGKKYYLWPNNSTVTPIGDSAFGWRIHPIHGDKRFHTGVDINGTLGSPVRAAAKGKVILAKYNGGYGNCVIIDHSNGIKTLYAHNNELKVKKGDTVKQGQVIAKCGSTGDSTGPHIHFEFMINGKEVNPLDYMSPKNQKICISHSTDTIKGICNNCGWEYIDYDNPDTSSKTNYQAKRFYRMKESYCIKAYPSDSAVNKTSKLSAGNYICVLGTVKDGTWYKIKDGSTSKYTGYVPVSKVEKYTPDKEQSTLSIEGEKSTYSVRKGSKATLAATVSSNYPIRRVKIEVGTYKPWEKYDTEFYVSQNISLQKRCGFDFSKLASGTHNYKFTVMDISGKTETVTGKIVVDDGIKQPTVTEELTENGKNIIIENTLGSGTIYYTINNGAQKKTTKASVTIPVSEKGITKVTAFVWNVDDTKRSANVSKSFTVEQLEMPSINIEQKGKTANVTLTAANSKDTIKYKIGSDAYKTYDGSVIQVEDGVTISAYAERMGCIRSAVEAVTTELGEPNAPNVSLVNEDGKIAQGQNATFCWDADRRASSYTATLYKAEDGTKVEEKTTEETTVSFMLGEVGDYYVEVTAENEIGRSEEAGKATVSAVAPLSVIFRDGTEEDASVLAEVKVDYGSTTEPVPEPSRKGHTFEGWENTKTGVVSHNAYVKQTVKENAEYVAVFSKNTYEVKLYDTDGSLIETQQIPYGEAVNTEGISVKLKDGYAFAGWHVVQTTEGDSSADYTCVDSDMELRAVAAWADKELPVSIEVLSAEQTADGRYVNAKVKLTTDETSDLSMYLVAGLKAVDSETGVEKTVYADRKIIYLDASADEAEKTVTMKLKADAKGISVLEVTALQCNEDLSTGSAYSKTVTESVTLSKNWGEWSEWSSEAVESSETRDAESRTEYRERNKSYVYSGYESLDGYTKEKSETLSTVYGDWRSSSPSTSETANSSNKTVISVDTTSAYRWFAYFCDCKKWAWKTSTGTCAYCGGKTKNTLVAYTKNIPTKYDSDGSYHFAETLNVSSTGNTRALYWNGSVVDSFTTKASNDVTYLWKSSPLSRTIYRTKTVKTRNLFSKWGEWSEWNETESVASSTREVENRTVYRYRDLEVETTGGLTLDPEGSLTRTFKGTIGVEEDLNGKVATIMVYQANNTDPNRYQMQYLGQTVIGEGNQYNFQFIPKDEPTVDSGNYIVSMAVQGTTGLITAGIVEAPVEEHAVNLFYKDNDGVKQSLGEEQLIRHHGDVNLSGIEIPEREGYYFVGWSTRTTDITEDCEIEAVYVPLQNTVVFVDWISRSLDMQKALTGTEIELPGMLEDIEGYQFKGWKLEDGSIINPTETSKISVAGDMVITAEFEAKEYTVNFVAENGTVVDTQTVKYGEAAQPPVYTPENGIFISWSTDTNWWNVENDTTVYPVIVYDESALKPDGNLVMNEETEEITLEMSTEEEGGEIYYTTDGTIPTVEGITEYLLTDELDYAGSIKKYDSALSFEEDTYVTAVTYIAGKTESEPESIFVTQETEAPEDTDVYLEEGWTQLAAKDVKAQAGKDVTVEVSVGDNTGLTAYDFIVSCDNSVFYADRNEYDEPVCEKGNVSENGSLFTKETEEGVRMTWIADEATEGNGKLFTLTLHVEENAEAGVYPVSVGYARENTLDGNYDEASMDDVNISIKSEASVDINAYEAVLSRTSYVYDGTAVEPAVTIEGLKEGEDYEVTYADNIHAGTATVIIKGIGGYEGVLEMSFEITPANIVNAQIGTLGDTSYNGDAIEPNPEITYNGVTLEKGADYELTYADNVLEGQAKMTVTGKSNYTGTVIVEFNIEKSAADKLEDALDELGKLQENLEKLEEELEQLRRIDIIRADVEVKGSHIYTGNVIRPEVSVAYRGHELKEGIDYTIAYENNLNAGTATIVITGLGDYKDTARVGFVIAKADISSRAVSIGYNSTVYDGTAKEPSVTLPGLVKDTHYTVSYADNINVGTAKVIVEGIGNYGGTINKTFTITKPECSHDWKQATCTTPKTCKICGETSGTATGHNKVTVPGKTATCETIGLTEGQKCAACGEIFVAQMEVAKKEHTASVTISPATDSQDGETTKKCAECQEILNVTKISKIATVALAFSTSAYNGKVKNPKVIVKDSNGAIISADNYTVKKPSGRKNVGKYTYTIEFKGNYAGSKKLTLTINPKSAVMKKPVSVKKGFTAKWNKVSKQTTGYEIMYATNKKFSSGKKTVVIKNYKTTSKKITGLKSKKTYYVKMRAYKTVNGKKYYSTWSSIKQVKTK